MLVLCIFFPRLATSECPNACSAHGTCGPYDMCRCFKNFMGKWRALTRLFLYTGGVLFHMGWSVRQF